MANGKNECYVRVTSLGERKLITHTFWICHWPHMKRARMHNSKNSTFLWMVVCMMRALPFLHAKCKKKKKNRKYQENP